MNWSWARTPDYEELTSTLERNTQIIRQRAWYLKEYARIDGNYDYMKDRAAPFLEKMEVVHRKTDSLSAFIEKIKTDLKYCDSITQSNRIKKANVKSTIQKYRPEELIRKIEDHISQLNKLGASSWEKSLKNIIPILQEQAKSYKDEQSAESLVAILSAIQNTVAGVEYACIRHHTNCIGSYGCVWTEMLAIAIADKYFALPGQKITAKMALVVPARENDRMKEEFLTRNGHISKIDYGVAYWEGHSKYPGVTTISGKIRLTIYRINAAPDESYITADTTISEHPWSFQYTVLGKGISMQLDNTNICYAGIDNPISISVPGFDINKLTLNVKDAKVTKTAPGKFNIYFKQIPKEKVYAFVEGTNKQGNTSIVGSLPLTVKEYPTPLASISGVYSGYLHLRHFRNSQCLSAQSQLDDFEMNYTIISYKLSLLCHKDNIYIEPIAGKGNFRNNPGILKMLDIARRGDKAIFEDIVAKDANGRTIELAPIMLKLY